MELCPRYYMAPSPKTGPPARVGAGSTQQRERLRKWILSHCWRVLRVDMKGVLLQGEELDGLWCIFLGGQTQMGHVESAS